MKLRENILILDKEVKILKNMFASNGYPAQFFDSAFIDFGTLGSLSEKLKIPRKMIVSQ